MNGNEDREPDARDDDPVMDWALGERVGGEQPPDLVAGVRDRLASAEPAPGRRLWSQLWVAALLLLGVFVVVGVAAWPRGGSKAAAPTQGAPEPKLEPVHSLADVAALPVSTRGVEASSVDDAVVAALVRLRELEVLVVREPWNESFGLGLKMTAPSPTPHVTAATWQTVFQLKKIRRLEFSGTPLVARLEPAHLAAFAAGLEALPLLDSLTLRCLDTSDELLAALPKARGLRRLDLSFNHGFVDDGVAALLRCTSLRSLSLRGCQQLHDNDLARLAELPELVDLDVSLIDGMNWRAGTGEVDDEVARQTRLRAQRHADRLGMGPGSTTFAALAAHGRLRSLDISGGQWRTQDLGLLRGVFFDDGRDGALLKATGGQFDGSNFVRALPSSLQRLDVCGDYTDEFCTAVAEHLTNLRHLNIAACYQITDRGLAAVAAMPSLRVLDMRQMRGLSVGSIATLLAAKQLEDLDVRHCDFITAAHVVELRRVLPHLLRLQASVDPADVAAAQKQAPWMVKASSKGQIETYVRTDMRAIEGIGLDDERMASLAQSKVLERLVLRPEMMEGPVASLVTPITDAGLQQLAKLPTLRVLHLDRCRQTTLAGLAVIAQLPVLEELLFSVMSVPDEFFARLKGTSLQRLTIEGCCGFGQAGVEAITQLRDLRELSFMFCVHLEESWLERLAELPRLERLDLSYVGSHTFLSGMSELGSRVEPGAGVTARVLTALGKAPKLRELSVAYAAVDAAGLRGLQSAPSLQSLDLSGTSVRTADLEVLPRSLTRLALSNCHELDQAFGQVLVRATPDLQTLVLADIDTLQDECLAPLRELRSLRDLDLSRCTGLSEAAIGQFAAMPQLETLTLRELPAFDAAAWDRVRALPKLKVLVTDRGREVLRR